MTIRSLLPIFNPATVAVVGASNKPGSVGGAILSNLKRSGFPGHIYAVNAKHHLIDGEIAYSALEHLPEKPDLVIVSTPASTVPGLVRQCGQLEIPGMIVISAGFREAGPTGLTIESELSQAAREFPNVRFLGPNCLGVLKPDNRLNASFSPIMPSSGRISFISQSGALCTAILDWAMARRIGFAHCVSVGNMTNVGMGDLIEYFADDNQTDVILLYIEGINDAPHFLEAARKCTRCKPIVAFKAGRYGESAAAAASHTGAIATADAVYDAAFRQAGIERVFSIEELFDYSQLCKIPTRPKGDRLAIVTNAGGPAVMASDAWLDVGGHLAKLTGDTVSSLDQCLPSCWSKANPIDILGDATADRFRSAIRLTAADPNVDAVLVILTPQAMTEPSVVAQTVIEERSKTDKPVVTSWIGGVAVQGGRSAFQQAGIPTYDFPEDAVHALKHFMSTIEIQSKSEREPAVVAEHRSSGCPAVRVSSERIEHWRQKLPTAGLVDEVTAKQLLKEYGIPVAESSVAHFADEAASIADKIGYPVVLKIVSPDISHKSDVGGVALDIRSPSFVREQFSSMMDTVNARLPHAKIDGISIQPMIDTHGAIELLLGMTRDRQFGPVVVLGAGGFTAELQRDSRLELPPFNREVTDRMIQSLRLFPLLRGYRNQRGVDLDQLRDVIGRFCQLIEDYPTLAAAEINPLSVSSHQIIALDARMVCSESQVCPRQPQCSTAHSITDYGVNS